MKKLKAREFDPKTIPSTMGCRTYSSWDVNWKEDFEKTVKKIADGEKVDLRCPLSSSHLKDGRGNIAPATIILPTLGMEAKRKAERAGKPEYVVEYFMDILERAIEDCRDELIERYEWICAQDPRSASFMWNNDTFFSYDPEEGIKGAFKHGTLAIGQIGLAETLRLLVGEDQCSSKGMELAKQIEQLFKDKCKAFKEEWRCSPISDEDIAEDMCKRIEKDENRKLSTKEKDEILQFVKSKHQ